MRNVALMGETHFRNRFCLSLKMFSQTNQRIREKKSLCERKSEDMIFTWTVSFKKSTRLAKASNVFG